MLPAKQALFYLRTPSAPFLFVLPFTVFAPRILRGRYQSHMQTHKKPQVSVPPIVPGIVVPEKEEGGFCRWCDASSWRGEHPSPPNPMQVRWEEGVVEPNRAKNLMMAV